MRKSEVRKMEMFFKWVISTSIKGSILIGWILFMKWVVKNKVGARWHYYVWFLALIRLIMPVAPQSEISIFNLFAMHPKAELMTKNIGIYHPSTIISWFKNSVQMDGFISNSKTLIEVLVEGDIYLKLMIVWIIGGSLIFFYIILANVKLWLRVKRDSICTDEKTLMILKFCKGRMGIRRNLPIIKTKIIQTPTLFGLIKPCILLPMDIDKKLERKGLEHVISHELAHFKRKDIAVFWIMGILQIIHWFNPIIWYGFYKMRQDCEIACDHLVLSYIGPEECKNYGHTMITLLEKTTNKFQPAGMAGFSTQKSQLKRRIKMITLFKKNTYKFSIIAGIILILVGCTFLTNADSDKNIKENNSKITNHQLNENEENISSEKSNEKENVQEMLWPLPQYKKITSTFGKKKHPKLNKVRMHTGIDIAAPRGKEIVAAAEGKVIKAGELGAYGKTIIIDHGNGVATFYGHCSELLVKEDAAIKKGDKIAKVGSTGKSTGPHLHFEVRKDGNAVDPLEYVENEQK
ncbi:MAG: peptidoglycan DD-metalloendopeptidase family protein [Marinisporobacter sp.]|jgi:bla regulator protein BlaR1|nr:peptidoglycan DD-metalloendopeptidase family protein [Marinisporobacter sp.]